MIRPKAPCPACGAPVRAADAFCPACGAAVPSEARPAPVVGPRRTAPRRRAMRHGDQSRLKSMASAAVAILVLAVMYALGGTIFGFMARSEVSDAIRALSSRSASDVITVEGKTRTVAEWRNAIERAPTLIFVTNYGLAAIFVGLFFWARKQAFPAILTAFFLWLATLAITTILDPTTLLQGLIVKIFAIVALLGGLQAALGQRSAERRRLEREAERAEKAQA
jgi:hypothetical protein